MKSEAPVVLMNNPHGFHSRVRLFSLMPQMSAKDAFLLHPGGALEDFDDGVLIYSAVAEGAGVDLARRVSARLWLLGLEGL